MKESAQFSVLAINYKYSLKRPNAVIVSQLIYGLETLCLNDSLIKRLDAFHVRGIRHILGIEHSYWSRTSNMEIMEKANGILFGKPHNTCVWNNFIRPSNEKHSHIRLVSEIIKGKQIKLLEHIMRCDERDPLYQCTFTNVGTYNVYGLRRVGRPRGHWGESVMNMAMMERQGIEFDRDDVGHYLYLFCEAFNRTPT